MSVTVSPDPDALLRRADTLLGEGRLGAARPLVAALGRLDAAPERVADLRARLAMAEERWAEAGTVLDAAIEAHPGHAALHRRRAELRGQEGRAADAALDAAEAVLLDPSDAAARALLGVALLMLGRSADACACLEDALSRAPHNEVFRIALADALDQAGHAEDARAVLAEGVARRPGAAALRSRAVLLDVRGHRWKQALEGAEAARQAGAADALMFGMMGHALSSLGRGTEAAGAYAEALKLGPEDAYVRHLVSASGGVPCAARAPDAYVRAVFDGYAERFDAHLVSLGYRVPGVMRAAVLEAPAAEGWVLDVGCGTGLMGAALSDVPHGPLVGVDLSPGMLARAAARGVYAELHEAEATAFLAAETRRFALIVAADVLCYFGPLDEVLALMAARLAPCGRCLVSVETGALGSGWRIAPSGRYTHDAAHVARAAEAAGLRVARLEPEALRTDVGGPVAGLVAVLAHADG